MTNNSEKSNNSKSISCSKSIANDNEGKKKRDLTLR